MSRKRGYSGRVVMGWRGTHPDLLSGLLCRRSPVDTLRDTPAHCSQCSHVCFACSAICDS